MALVPLARSNRRLHGMLEGREELYRALATGSADVITVIDRDGRLRWVSPSAESLLGTPADDARRDRTCAPWCTPTTCVRSTPASPARIEAQRAGRPAG